jgi:ABC-type transport system involved in cytochrome c biogenesis permease component
MNEMEQQLSNPHDSAPSFWHWLDSTLVGLSERLNPILVKETRQALKSRQFIFSFALVLIACWGWSIAGAAIIGPSISYRASGPELFIGYYFILAFPLAVIVPYSAYRSLSSENEENTYDLLSITTLSPWQIVSGKLGSAAAQIAVFFCAVAPCLAFTYLLRGIDIITIGVLMLYTVLGSLGLSMIGLLLATTTREKYGQGILSVGIVIGLFWTFVFAVMMTIEFLRWGGRRVNDREFWIVTAVLASAYVTYFSLCFLAAAARLTFPSENRSTHLRVAMLVQFACFAGWMAWPLLETGGTRDVIEIFLVVSIMHWYAMGALMTGESSQLSPRVKRNLPRSVLGRVFLTWFNPGPGTGYVFAVAGLAAALLMAGLAASLGRRPVALRGGSAPTFASFALGVLGMSYVIVFVGMGRWLIRVLRRFTPVNLFAGVGIHLILVGMCTAIPLVIQFNSVRWRNCGYSLLQTTNPFWTLAELIDRNAPLPETSQLLLIVPITAVLVFLLNLRSIAEEVQQVRISPPPRVAEDDAALAPPREPVKTSPWDSLDKPASHSG